MKVSGLVKALPLQEPFYLRLPATWAAWGKEGWKGDHAGAPKEQNHPTGLFLIQCLLHARCHPSLKHSLCSGYYNPASEEVEDGKGARD